MAGTMVVHPKGWDDAAAWAAPKAISERAAVTQATCFKGRLPSGMAIIEA